jgi:prevent-host-death family protein
MERIGIRELRQNASGWLRRVERGESFEVTAWGRPVALLVPATQDDILARLESEGSLHRGEGDLLSLPPLPADSGRPTISDLLRDLRAEER